MSWYDDLVKDRGEFGSLGFSIGDMLSPYYANTKGQLDPRLAQLGYSQYFKPGDESGGSQLTAPQGYGQEGQVMVNGVPYVQVSRQASSLVKDPSQVKYDDKYGAITPQANYNLQDSAIDRLVGGAIQGIAIGGPLAMMGGMVPGVEGVFGNGGLLGGSNWAEGGGFGAGGISPETAAGVAGAGDAAGVAGGPIVGASGLLSGDGLLGSAATWAMNNPLQAAGALYSASGLLGGGNNPSGSPGGNSSGPSNIGLLNPQAFQRPEWKPNANTLAQLNALYGGRYGG